TKAIPETNFDEVVRKMVGRELTDRFPKRNPTPGDTVLQVKGLTKKGKFEDVCFSVKAGEIVGVSGLMGAGRTEIMRAIFGLDPIDKGEIWLNGEKVTIKSPKQAGKSGIGFITEDRKDEGLILGFSIKDNMVLPTLSSFAPKGIINEKDESDFVQMLIKRLTVKTKSAEI